MSIPRTMAVAFNSDGSSWIKITRPLGFCAGLAMALSLIASLMLIGACTVGRFPMQEREMEAVRAIRVIQKAQEHYHVRHHRFGALEELRAEGLVGDMPQGYNFRVSPAADRFQVEAWPTAFRKTGSRSFVSDQSLQIRMSWTSTFNGKQSRVLE